MGSEQYQVESVGVGVGVGVGGGVGEPVSVDFFHWVFLLAQDPSLSFERGLKKCAPPARLP